MWSMTTGIPARFPQGAGDVRQDAHSHHLHHLFSAHRRQLT
jgi:hypothetical protein